MPRPAPPCLSHLPACPALPLLPLPAVKRETAKLVRDVLETTPKPVLLKLRDSVLPAVAALAVAGDVDVREAGQAAMVAFAVRAGSMSILDRVSACCCCRYSCCVGCCCPATQLCLWGDVKVCTLGR